MARQRFIWPDLWKDPTVGRLDPFALTFFIGCFSNADDDGRILGDPAYLRAEIFPYQDITISDVQAVRDRVLQACPNLVIYNANGKDVLWFRKWDSWQRPKYPKPSKLPAPPKSLKAASQSQNVSPNVPPSMEDTSPKLSTTGGVGQGWVRSIGSSTSTTDPDANGDTTANGLPFTHELRTSEILAAIGAHADEGTAGVVRAIARRLPEASLVKVAESTKRSRIKDRAAYAVKALQSELAETGRETDTERRTRKIAALRQDPEAWIRTNGHRLPDEALAEWLHDLVDNPDERLRLHKLALELREPTPEPVL